MDTMIGQFGDMEQARLALQMPEKLITLCEDETFHPQICLVSIEPDSNYIILEKYAKEAGINRNISPHRLRHFLLTWFKKQGIYDAFIQPYSGHSTRQSLEVYSKLSIEEAQEQYDQVINRFPV